MRAEELMTTVQAVAYKREGSVNKFLVDDKGVLMLLAFGLHPLCHEDDPVRAVVCALDVASALKARQFAATLGVATGPVWCGIVGTPERREYTVMGDTVNLAARLMCKATMHGVLCDKRTVDGSSIGGTKNRLEFRSLDPVRLKGKAKPVPIFEPTGGVIGPVFDLKRSPLMQEGYHWRLRHSCCECLARMEPTGGVLLARGHRPAGKKEVMAIATDWALGAGYRVFRGTNKPEGTPLVEPTPLKPFRDLILGILREEEGLRENLASLLPEEDAGAAADLLKVLEEGTGATKSLTERKSGQLCRHILDRYTARLGGHPTMLTLNVFEGTGFFKTRDYASIFTASLVAEMAMARAATLRARGARSDCGVSPLILVIVARHWRDGPDPLIRTELQRLISFAEENEASFLLQELKWVDETAKFVAAYLKVPDLECAGLAPGRLAAFLHEATNGCGYGADQELLVVQVEDMLARGLLRVEAGKIAYAHENLTVQEHVAEFVRREAVSTLDLLPEHQRVVVVDAAVTLQNAREGGSRPRGGGSTFPLPGMATSGKPST